MTIRDIMAVLETVAPLDLAEEWDNCGLLVGDPDVEVKDVLFTLDITPQAIDIALEMNAQLIISHHPVIFSPLKRLTADSVPYLLAKHGIAALCLHTNLDKAVGGVNDALITHLRWPAAEVAEDGLCRIVTLPEPISAEDMVDTVFKWMFCNDLRVHEGDRPIQKIGVCTGAGGGELLALIGQVDAILTGEIKHHEWLAFADAGITAIDAGHHVTESIFYFPLEDALRKAFPSLHPFHMVRNTEPFPYDTYWPEVDDEEE